MCRCQETGPYRWGTSLHSRALRLQLAPGIAAAFLTQIVMGWKVRGVRLSRARHLLIGAAPVVVLFGVVDAITWRYPFRSIWNYFAVNILAGKASKYGILPFDAFWDYFASVWSMALVPLILLVVRGARGKLPLAIAAIVTFFLHSLVGHKEYR